MFFFLASLLWSYWYPKLDTSVYLVTEWVFKTSPVSAHHHYHDLLLFFFFLHINATSSNFNFFLEISTFTFVFVFCFSNQRKKIQGFSIDTISAEEYKHVSWFNIYIKVHLECWEGLVLFGRQILGLGKQDIASGLDGCVWLHCFLNTPVHHYWSLHSLNCWERTPQCPVRQLGCFLCCFFILFYFIG